MPKKPLLSPEDKALRYKASFAKRKDTSTKRLSQRPRSFIFKLNSSKLSTLQNSLLPLFFLESKWLYNHCLSLLNHFYDSAEKTEELRTNKKGVSYIVQSLKDKTSYWASLPNILSQAIKADTVQVKVLDKFESRDISHLSSMMRAWVKLDLLDALNSIKSSKIKGNKVWMLSFKQECHSIHLNQYWNSHYIVDKHTLHIVGLWKVKVHGLNQLDKYEHLDLTTAKLVELNGSYYLHLTTFEDRVEKPKLFDYAVWIDFGVKTALVLSDWLSFDLKIDESPKLKKAQRNFSKYSNRVKKKNKGELLRSKRYNKKVKRLQKLHQKVVNQRQNSVNKIVNYLENYRLVVIQNEQIKNWIKSWMKGFAKKLRHNMAGAIIRSLKEKLPTLEIVDKYLATTKTCSKCWHKNSSISMWERIFLCEKCWFLCGRDHNASINIEEFFTNIKISLEQRNPMLFEIKTSTILSSLSLASLVTEKRSLPL